MTPILVADFPHQSWIPVPGVAIKSSRGFDPAYPVTADQQIAMAINVGAKVLRIDLPWASCELTAGVYTWPDYLVDVFNKAKAAGIKTLFILGAGNALYTPAWNSPPVTPAAITAFANFAKAAVAKFGITWAMYEIYNEPNLPMNWNGAPNPTQYGALLNATAIAIRSVAAKAIVISGGLAVFDPNTFIATALQNVDKSKLSAVGFHPYTGADAYASDPAMKMEGVTDRLAACKTAIGAGSPSVWNTEQGFAVCQCAGATLAEKLDRQGAFAARFVLNLLLGYRPWAIWYDLVDDGTDADNPEHMFGLYDHDMNIKPSGIAFKSVTGLIASCASAKAYRDGDFYQVVFSMPDGKSKTVNWSAAGQIPFSVVADESKLPVFV